MSTSISSGAPLPLTVVSATPTDTALFGSDIEKLEALSLLDPPYDHNSSAQYNGLAFPGSTPPEVHHRLVLSDQVGVYSIGQYSEPSAGISLDDYIVQLNPGGSPSDYVSNVVMSNLTPGDSYDLKFIETMRLWYRAETTGAAPPDSDHFWSIWYQRRPYYGLPRGGGPIPARLTAYDFTTASEVWNGSWGGAVVVDPVNPDAYPGIRRFTAQLATDSTDVIHLLSGTGGAPIDHYLDVEAHDFVGRRETKLHSQFYNYVKFTEVVPSP